MSPTYLTPRTRWRYIYPASAADTHNLTCRFSIMNCLIGCVVRCLIFSVCCVLVKAYKTPWDNYCSNKNNDLVILSVVLFIQGYRKVMPTFNKMLPALQEVLTIPTWISFSGSTFKNIAYAVSIWDMEHLREQISS